MQTTYNNVPAADAASNTDAGATDKSRSSLSPQEQAESSNAKNRVSRPRPAVLSKFGTCTSGNEAYGSTHSLHRADFKDFRKAQCRHLEVSIIKVFARSPSM